MFGYLFKMGIGSLARSWPVSLLMTLLISLGIAACLTSLTIMHSLAGNPVPGRGEMLFYVQVDPRDGVAEAGEAPPTQLTWTDGNALQHSGMATRQALMTEGVARVSSLMQGDRQVRVSARYTTADFFNMFEAPFASGRSWNGDDDRDASRVVVIGNELSRRLFGNTSGVGRQILINEVAFRVVGTLAAWRPTPHFYDLGMGAYAKSEDIIVPLSAARAAKLATNGEATCWGGDTGSEDERLEVEKCAWLQLWVLLDKPDQKKTYADYLRRYSSEQRSIGRFSRAPNVRLMSLNQWLDFNRVIPAEVKLQAWLGVGFLFVSIANVTMLMIAKFLRKKRELGIRRALGATRREIFMQLIAESAIVGISGGIVGIALTFAALLFVRKGESDYSDLAILDFRMLAFAVAISLLSAVLSGLLPAWNACRVSPALQIRAD